MKYWSTIHMLLAIGWSPCYESFSRNNPRSAKSSFLQQGLASTKSSSSSSSSSVTSSSGPRPPNDPPPEDMLTSETPFFVSDANGVEGGVNGEVSLVNGNVNGATEPKAANGVSQGRRKWDNPPPLQPLISNEKKKELSEAAEKFVEKVINPLVNEGVQPGVPLETVQGAALSGAILAFLASKGIIVSGAAALSAAYVSISSGVAGDAFRSLGSNTSKLAHALKSVYEKTNGSEKLDGVSKSVAKNLADALSNADNLAPLTSTWLKDLTGETKFGEPVELTEKELERVLQEAEVAIDAADSAIEKASTADITVPYDAAAKLAYAASDKSMAYADFKAKYEADAVADVIAKKNGKLEEARAAEAARAADEARIAEEARLAEAARLAEEAQKVRRAEEERLAAEENEFSEGFSDDWEESEDSKEFVDEWDGSEEAEEGESDDDAEIIDPEWDEAAFYNDEWEEAVKLAQQGLDGKIVGMEEAITDVDAKAGWDAAGSFAQQLESGIGDDFNDDEVELDMEALGRAARAAVEKFDADVADMAAAKSDQRAAWSDMMDDDVFDEDQESEDDVMFMPMDDIEEIGRQARLAVEKMETEQPVATTKDWSSLTVNLLKEELKSRGLKVSGKKADLVAALTQSDLEQYKSDVELDLEEFDEEEEQVIDADEPSDEILLRLETEGLFGNDDDESASRDDFESMTVAELKDELRNRGLRVSGRKAELIERLRSS